MSLARDTKRWKGVELFKEHNRRKQPSKPADHSYEPLDRTAQDETLRTIKLETRRHEHE